PRVDRARLMNLQAAGGAVSHLSIECKDDHGYPVKCDALITGPWGGVWLEPFIQTQASTNQVRMVSNPFAVLARIWPDGLFPAPDPTTRDGLRVFYSQTDGDGFSTP